MASRRSIIWDDQLYRPIKMTKRMRNCVSSWNVFKWATSRNAHWTNRSPNPETTHHLCFRFVGVFTGFGLRFKPTLAWCPVGWSALGSGFAFSLR